MKNLFDVKGQYAVVAGASSGIGYSIAMAFAEAGCNVAVLARRKEKLEDLAAEIEKLGVKALAISCDVSDIDSCKSAVEEITKEFPRIDILVNNAGIAVRGTVDDIDMAEWDKSFDINVKGIVHLSKFVVPIMKENKYGRIVNTASVNALISDKGDPFLRHSYNSSKAAVWGLTRAMAASYAQFGIAVNCVGPGLFETEMTEGTLFKSDAFLKGYSYTCPASRPGNLEEINGPILFLSSPAASYVQGQMLFVDGGITLV